MLNFFLVQEGRQTFGRADSREQRGAAHGAKTQLRRSTLRRETTCDLSLKIHRFEKPDWEHDEELGKTSKIPPRAIFFFQSGTLPRTKLRKRENGKTGGEKNRSAWKHGFGFLPATVERWSVSLFLFTSAFCS